MAGSSPLKNFRLTLKMEHDELLIVKLLVLEAPCNTWNFFNIKTIANARPEVYAVVAKPMNFEAS